MIKIFLFSSNESIKDFNAKRCFFLYVEISVKHRLSGELKMKN